MVVFQAYRIPLVALVEFKYLGRFLTDSDEDCLVLVGNFRKSRKRW